MRSVGARVVALWLGLAAGAVGRELRRGAGETVADGARLEPSCDELRAMWRFSKRQSRAAEATNEVPVYRDPFAYNVWEALARARSAGGGRGRWRRPAVYGRVVHAARGPEPPERLRAFEEVARMFAAPRPAQIPRRKTSFRLGGGSSFHGPSLQAGSFQHLKELIRTERARELREQRLSEAADRTGLGRADNPLSPDRPPARGVVAFPDLMSPPSSYLDEKFRHRYPDTNVGDRRSSDSDQSPQRPSDTESSTREWPEPRLRLWRPRRLRREVRRAVRREEERQLSFRDAIQAKVQAFKIQLAAILAASDALSQCPAYPESPPLKMNAQGGTSDKQDSEKRRKAVILEKFRSHRKTKKSDSYKDFFSKEMEKLDDPEVLNETYMRKLTGRQPKATFPIYEWDYFSMEYKERLPEGDHEEILDFPSKLIHIDSQEAKWQLEDESASGGGSRWNDNSAHNKKKTKASDLDKDDAEKDEGEEGEEEAGEEAGEDGEDGDDKIDDGDAEEAEEIDEEVDEGDERYDDDEANPSMADGTGDKKEKEDGEESELESAAGEALNQTDEEPPIRYKKTKKLFNLFNFTDRGTQGCIHVYRDRMSQTSPVPMGRLNAFVCPYVLYDVYQKDLIDKEVKKDDGEVDPNLDKNDSEFRTGEQDQDSSEEEEPEAYRLFNQETVNKAKILERMAVQNTLQDLIADMQFYDDPADEINKGEGSVLPLWIFKCDDFDGIPVTAIHFSPSYPDMFGVSHGCLDFEQPINKGYVSVFSIKDPMTPEYKKACTEPITSFDYHPKMISYIAYSTYGGNVHCCDVRDPSESDAKALRSSVEDAHQGIIWQVLWDPDPENLNFYTISTDGSLFRWNVRNANLVRNTVLLLNYPKLADEMITLKHLTPQVTPESQHVQAMATTMVFHPTNKEHIFIGTSEGFIIKCSLIYSTSYLFVYYSHTLNVSRIHFNTYIKNLFISASEDRKVNIHEEGRLKPLYTFTQQAGVTDVQWAPYSSTVFALVTMDCHVAVYDLNINKARPVCNQYVVSRAGGLYLTSLRFSPTRTFILIGDTSGTVLSLKLSPNLRIKPKKGKRQNNFDPLKLEIMKLQTCINYIREPEQEIAHEEDVMTAVADDEGNN